VLLAKIYRQAVKSFSLFVHLVTKFRVAAYSLKVYFGKKKVRN